MKPEEIAKLWMNENSIVNQKTVYFTAVNAALAAVCARGWKMTWITGACCDSTFVLTKGCRRMPC